MNEIVAFFIGIAVFAVGFYLLVRAVERQGAIKENRQIENMINCALVECGVAQPDDLLLSPTTALAVGAKYAEFFLEYGDIRRQLQTYISNLDTICG